MKSPKASVMGALARARTAFKESAELADELKSTRQDRDETRSELASYVNTRYTAAQVMSVAATIRELRQSYETLQAENTFLASCVKSLRAEVDKNSPVKLPEITTTVSVSNPKWRFVVLAAGSNEGMLKRGELLVSRSGQLIAKVKIIRVEEGRSFANIVPGWDFGDIRDGDVAVPAHPDFSRLAFRN